MPSMIMFLAAATIVPAVNSGQITVDRSPPISKTAPGRPLPRQGKPTRMTRVRIVLDHMPRELVTYAAPPGWNAPTPNTIVALATAPTLTVSRDTQFPVTNCPTPFYDRVNLGRAIARGFRIVSWKGAPSPTTGTTLETPMEIVAIDQAGQDVSANPSAATGIRVRPPVYGYQYPSSRGCTSSYYLVITIEGPIGVDPLAVTFSRPRHRGPAGN